MSGKSKIKWIKSLQLKKYRQAEQCFIVQGRKGVMDLLLSGAFQVPLILATSDCIQEIQDRIRSGTEVIYVSARDLESLGTFQSNDSLLAVARMNEAAQPEAGAQPILVLDDIRDPGNLGTIIRTADWFGCRHIVTSESTVDFYNPKVISATMGSFCRVQVYPTDLPSFLNGISAPAVYGTFMRGEPVQDVNFDLNPIFVIGNESNGISPAVAEFVTRRVTIPGVPGAESLNAAVASSILLYAWFSRS